MTRVTVHVVARPSLENGKPGVGWMDAILDRVDDYGIDRLSIGDVQGNHIECFSGLGYLAAKTRRVALGPLVTNAVTRDVGVIAAAAASLDALSRGRAFLVFGRGDGVAHNLDLRADSVAGLAEAIAAIRALLGSGHCRYRGREIMLPWPGCVAPRIPLYAAAGGPRMLAMAATVCDGVYLANGCASADVEAAGAIIDRAERDGPLDRWWVTRFGIGDSYADAFAAAAEGLSSIGNHALRGDYGARGVPEGLRASLREYHARYSYERKNPITGSDERGAPAGGPSNVELMLELGLDAYFVERFGVVGTPEMVVERLRDLKARGVDSVVLLANSARELQLIGTQVLPALHSAETRSVDP